MRNDGLDVGAGFKPALPRRNPIVTPSLPRHCEAPVSPRYVGRYRCEAIQCRERNIRLTYLGWLRQPWIALPHINGTYRKCGGGFAMTGLASPCPVPAHCAGTVDGGTTVPRILRPNSPLGRGAAKRRGGFPAPCAAI
ncbi:MAG: hypothetical protein LBM98_05450 [Oscillospiraceae bacterium]|nr:hypothetical protein [Oscillospiraceae bacterium]